MAESQAEQPSGLRGKSRIETLGRPLLGTAADSIPVFAIFSIGLAGAYCLTIIYGIAAGYALPTAAVFQLPHTGWLPRFETILPRFLILVAFAGTALGWLANTGYLDAARLRRNETTALALLARWGVFILAAALLLALTQSGGWNGQPVLNYGSGDGIAGLIPSLDAHAYFHAPVQQMLSGEWNELASRRPFAAAFRELIMAAVGLSPATALVAQTILIAAALALAARSIALWRGVWAAIAFSAFLYTIARPFLATLLTEPLALFWALISIAFFVEALRLNSRSYALLALAALTIAEIIRMGSLFTVPALALWIVLAFGSSARDRVASLGLCVGVVTCIIAIQSACATLYGSPGTAAGSNFAYTLCGLAAGKDWTACPELFSRQFAGLGSEREQTTFLVTKAMQLVSESPAPMLARMAANIRELFTGLPGFLLNGIYTHRPLQEFPFLLALVPGLYLAWRKRTNGETAFWLLFVLSLTASAALIFADEGWRAMHATWPFVALFASLGFVSPLTTSLPSQRPLVSRRGAGYLIGAIAALTLVAPAAAQLWDGNELRRLGQSAALPSEKPSAVLAGSTVTGFLVIPDDAQVPKNVPALKLSVFFQMAKDLRMPLHYGDFLGTAGARVPFALFDAARLDQTDDQGCLYIASPDILVGNAAAWRVVLGDRISAGNAAPVCEINSVRPLH